MRRKGTVVSLGLAAVAAVAVAFLTAGGAGARSVASYPRDQTLYTSGTQYGPPSSWNPMNTGGYATGTVGLVYESLFRYDPLADKFIPWLAKSGRWTTSTVYTATLRSGIKWSDGKPVTADDVLFTVNLGKIEGVPYSNVWTFLKSAEKVNNTTVRFLFSTANYQEWANFLYNYPILPMHIWQGRSEKDVVTGANPKPVGTGPYKYLTHDQDRMVWVRNEGWWAKSQLHLTVKPKYVVDIVNGSNNVMLGLVLQGGIDVSNNFLPGIASLVDRGYVKTYYPEAPYNLSANTAWLVMNTTKAPLNDKRFRRALAYSIDVGKIVEADYANLVKASDPTGLLPNWSKYVDKSVVKQLGFSFKPKKAQAILTAAGYKKGSDGYFRTPGGAKIDLTLINPLGWTDWEEANRIIAASAKTAGIKITSKFPDYNALVAARNAGKFDLAINNNEQLTNTPWRYYNYIFRLPILDSQTDFNFGRYQNQAAWTLVQQLDRTPTTNISRMKSIISKLQRIQLTDMPIIPLWYNGAWANFNESTWTNWPSSTGNHYLAQTWRGYWQMTSLDMLTHLKLAPKK